MARFKKQIIRVDKDGNPERLGDLDAAADKVPCEPRTLQNWIADGKEHYGFTYKYE